MNTEKLFKIILIFILVCGLVGCSLKRKENFTSDSESGLNTRCPSAAISTILEKNIQSLTPDEEKKLSACLSGAYNLNKDDTISSLSADTSCNSNWNCKACLKNTIEPNCLSCNNNNFLYSNDGLTGICIPNNHLETIGSETGSEKQSKTTAETTAETPEAKAEAEKQDKQTGSENAGAEKEAKTTAETPDKTKAEAEVKTDVKVDDKLNSFIQGDGKSYVEIQIKSYTNDTIKNKNDDEKKQFCIDEVKKNHKEANGVTMTKNLDKCYAEFKMSGRKNSKNYYSAYIGPKYISPEEKKLDEFYKEIKDHKSTDRFIMYQITYYTDDNKFGYWYDEYMEVTTSSMTDKKGYEFIKNEKPLLEYNRGGKKEYKYIKKIIDDKYGNIFIFRCVKTKGWDKNNPTIMALIKKPSDYDNKFKGHKDEKALIWDYQYFFNKKMYQKFISDYFLNIIKEDDKKIKEYNDKVKKYSDKVKPIILKKKVEKKVPRLSMQALGKGYDDYDTLGKAYDDYIKKIDPEISGHPSKT